MSDQARRRASAPPALESGQALHRRVRAAILDAAARTFAMHGEAANLADVANAAGVARATAYRYFPNRRRLVEEVAQQAAEDAGRRLTAARIDELPLEESLIRAVRAFVEVGDAFVVLVREHGQGESEVFDRLVAEPVRRFLDAGRAAGEIRDDIPTASLAESVFGLVSTVQRHGSLGPDDTVAAVAGLFLEGARVDGSPKR